MPVWIDKTLGKIHIERLLGRGGMAEVYYGTHSTLSRPVAVKILHAYLEEQGDLSVRFAREARVSAGLRHPNIVQVFDFDLFEGQPYIVMEYINGPSLSAYLRSLHERGRRMPLGMIRRILPLLAGALDYAHSQGLIHRDIKPGNVLLQSRTGQIEMGDVLPADVEPLLADFGLVRVLDSPLQTSSGLITGTPAYMSPEQARGQSVDHRTDVYSLGVLLYELLSGTLPFEGDTALVVIQKIIHEPPASIPELAGEMQSVLDRALQKDPAQRYQSAGELANAFMGALGVVTEANTLPPMVLPTFQPEKKTPPVAVSQAINIPARRPLWPALAAVIVIVALVALGLFLRKPPITPPVDGTIVSTMEHGSASPAANLPVGEGPLSVGVLRFQNVVSSLDGVTIKARAIPLPADGAHYEVWLTEGENRRSLGVLELDENGDGELSFADDQSRNLLGIFDRMEITEEPSPDANPNSSGKVLFSSGIPSESLLHIRHLLVSIPNTPGQVGLIHGLLKDAQLVDDAANAMLSAFDAGDETALRLNAEALVNIIVGSQSEMYGDLDGDGSVTDPGDGYGFLLNGDSPGYTGGAAAHTQYAMQAAGAPESVLIHGEHVLISIANVEAWAVTLRDLALSILQDPLADTSRASIVHAVSLADQLLKGIDLDGNERIDAVPGEGGALTAYQHAYYMADMNILMGAGQILPPSPPPDVIIGETPYIEK